MAGKGVVIQISADAEVAKRQLELVRQQVRETQSATDSASGTNQRFTASAHGMVPGMAAASAGLRALEGNFTNNIRAGERFLTMLPGMAEALQAAFPYIGAVVLGTALVRLGGEAYHAFQNVVNLKGALNDLNELEIKVAKGSEEAADKRAAAMERYIEATQGHAAALRFKQQDENERKGVDLRDYFYSDEFKKLPTSVKADYEAMYKVIAPKDIPGRIAQNRREIEQLNEALTKVKQTGRHGLKTFFTEDGGDPVTEQNPWGTSSTAQVNGYGPTGLQDPLHYYEMRLKAAMQIGQELQDKTSVRPLESKARDAEIAKADKDEAKKKLSEMPATNPATVARTQYLEEQGRVELDIVRSRVRARLAEEDAQHRMLLTGDQQYFANKMSLQNEEFDAEQKAIDQRRVFLENQLAKQKRDPKLHRDEFGESAETYKTKAELAKNKEQNEDLHSKRLSTESAYNAEVNASNVAAEIASLRVAAQLERERNSGIEAQIALLRREHELEAQRSTLAGGSPEDAEAIKAQGELEVKKLQLGDVQQDINRVEDEHRRRIADVNDAVTKGVMSKREAAQATRDANTQEMQDLRALIERYRELAQAIGDPTLLQKVQDLQAEMDNLGRKDRRGTFGKELTDGMQSMTSSIVENAALGRQSFGQMARGILDDIDRMAVKMATEKFLAPLFDVGSGGATGGSTPGAMGGGFGGFLKGLFSGEHHASGGIGSDMPQLVGDAGGHGELWTPPTRGGQYTTSAILKRLAEGPGSGGKVPNVTTNVINQSSQPVRATTSQPSYDSQLREMVTHVILTDAHEGGSISQAFGH